MGKIEFNKFKGLYRLDVLKVCVNDPSFYESKNVPTFPNQIPSIKKIKGIMDITKLDPGHMVSAKTFTHKFHVE